MEPSVRLACSSAYSRSSAELFWELFVLLGDPSFLLRGSAKLVYWQIKSIRQRLNRLALLFVSYIITVAFIVVAAIMSDIWPTVACVLIRCSVAIGTTALIYSMCAPFLYLGIQKDRLDRELENRLEKDKQAPGLHATL